MDTQKFIEDRLKPSAKDALESYEKALKIIGTKDFVYSEVKDFPEMPGNGVYPHSGQVELHEGIDSLPQDYQFDVVNLLNDNFAPYLVIKQGDFINYLVVDSDLNYDLETPHGIARGVARKLTLPRQNGMDFVGYAYVRNLAHPEYGLDHGNIGFANLGDAISRTV